MQCNSNKSKKKLNKYIHTGTLCKWHLGIFFYKNIFEQIRESKRSDENSEIFTLTCNQFPYLSMVPYHITIKMVLSPKIFKSSKMYNHKSVRALFSAPNHFLHLFFQLYQFEEKRIRRLKAVYIHTIQHLSITFLRSNGS